MTGKGGGLAGAFEELFARRRKLRAGIVSGSFVVSLLLLLVTFRGCATESPIPERALAAYADPAACPVKGLNGVAFRPQW